MPNKIVWLGTCFIYRNHGRISESRYAERDEAEADASKPQRVNANGHLEPDVDETIEISDFDEAIPVYPYPSAD